MLFRLCAPERVEEDGDAAPERPGGVGAAFGPAVVSCCRARGSDPHEKVASRVVLASVLSASFVSGGKMAFTRATGTGVVDLDGDFAGMGGDNEIGGVAAFSGGSISMAGVEGTDRSASEPMMFCANGIESDEHCRREDLRGIGGDGGGSKSDVVGLAVRLGREILEGFRKGGLAVVLVSGTVEVAVSEGRAPEAIVGRSVLLPRKGRRGATLSMPILTRGSEMVRWCMSVGLF